ncbi:LOW QUALITY PROTEIN: uncharacterized protein LOC131381647 [Hylobates moloch]|uniref:LOW QUALITY PROTEIN: uncharacterized protein LOC131381647 n=1 Tax=Hylobates moloch TaxID=81572 RepID=UPI0026773574|nr:LOW QUALITY PROTEIN: uncharacterized protein LOC131381647 [Hylobates moloch]
MPLRNNHAEEAHRARGLVGKLGRAGDLLLFLTHLTKAFPSRPSGSPQTTSHGRRCPINEPVCSHELYVLMGPWYHSKQGQVGRDPRTTAPPKRPPPTPRRRLPDELLLTPQPGEGAGLPAQSCTRRAAGWARAALREPTGTKVPPRRGLRPEG